MRSSDYDIGFVCPKCGSLLTPQANPNKRKGHENERNRNPGDPWECPPCSLKEQREVRCHPVPIPWVFRYLACEMASMNVKMKLRLADRARQASLAPPSGLAARLPVQSNVDDDGDDD